MKKNILSLYRRYISHIPDVKSYILIALLVLGVGLAVTLFSWYSEKQRYDDQKQTQVNSQASAVSSDIRGRLKYL